MDLLFIIMYYSSYKRIDIRERERGGQEGEEETCEGESEKRRRRPCLATSTTTGQPSPS